MIGYYGCCTKYCTACDSSFILSIKIYITLCKQNIKHFTLVSLARTTSAPWLLVFLRDMEKLKYIYRSAMQKH